MGAFHAGSTRRCREAADEGADGVTPSLFGVIAGKRDVAAVLDDGESFAQGVELERRLDDRPAAETPG